MVALAIMSVMLVIGLPSYSAWIANTQIRAAAEATLNGMQLARAEAVRRNVNVEFVFGATSAWTVREAAAGTVVQTRGAGQGSTGVTVVRTPAAATIVTFNSLGRVVANAGGTATLTQADFDVAVARLAASSSRNLRVVVNAGGNVRMCDPTVTDVTDPRICT